MAMPPGGQSSWFHHADAYHLLDARDQIWAMLNVPVAPTSLPRGQFGRLMEGELPVATLEARPGELAVIDARGLTRLVMRLGEAPDPAWPAGERGVIAADGTTVACFCLPTGDGAGVKKVAVSLP